MLLPSNCKKLANPIGRTPNQDELENPPRRVPTPMAQILATSGAQLEYYIPSQYWMLAEQCLPWSHNPQRPSS